MMIDVADPTTDERLYRDLGGELMRLATALVDCSDTADVMANAMATGSWPAVENHPNPSPTGPHFTPITGPIEYPDPSDTTDLGSVLVSMA